MNTIKESATYQALASSGLCKFHKVSIQTEGKDYFLVKEWWSVKQDGEESLHQFSVPKKIKAKNIGKTNETSLYDQSLAEYESTISKYLDKGYHLKVKYQCLSDTGIPRFPVGLVREEFEG